MVALGNEIPAAVVRWHGQARVEQFLRELYDEAKAASPDTLFTYVNFPPTEYLELPFLDVCAFNVYLHDEAKLRRYLARLQHVAGQPAAAARRGGRRQHPRRPGRPGGTHRHAGARGVFRRRVRRHRVCLDRRVVARRAARGRLGVRPGRPRAAPEAGRRRRRRRCSRDAPFSAAEQRTWPKVSVVVCAYNAADTLDDCLTSLGKLDYPDYEVDPRQRRLEGRHRGDRPAPSVRAARSRLRTTA